MLFGVYINLLSKKTHQTSLLQFVQENVFSLKNHRPVQNLLIGLFNTEKEAKDYLKRNQKDIERELSQGVVWN